MEQAKKHDPFIANEMARLSKVLEEAKINEANLTGQLNGAMKRLKEEEGLETVEQADSEIISLQNELAKVDQEITTKFNALKENYEW